MPDTDRVPAALRHSFTVLDAVAQAGPGGTNVPEIAVVTGLNERTVYRHLASLRALAMVVSASGSKNRYRLGPGIAAMAVQASDQAHFLRIARSFAEETGERTGQPVHVTVLDHGTAVTVASATPDLVAKKSPPIVLGARRPAHASASGKLFLAHNVSAFRSYVLRPLERFTEHTLVTPEALEKECLAVRENGWATDRQEFMTGVTCVAVPVRGANDRVVGTLSVSTTSPTMSARRRNELLGHLFPAAAEFSRAVGGRSQNQTP